MQIKSNKEKVFFKIALLVVYLDKKGEPTGIAKVLDNAIMNRFTYKDSVEELLTIARRCRNFEVQMDAYGIKMHVKFNIGLGGGLELAVLCDGEKTLLKKHEHEGESEPSLDFSAYCDRILDLCDGITIASFEGKVIT